MKGIVIVKFGCKNTKKIYEVGSEFEGTDERVAELVKKEKVEVEKTKEKVEVKAQPKNKK